MPPIGIATYTSRGSRGNLCVLAHVDYGERLTGASVDVTGEFARQPRHGTIPGEKLHMDFFYAPELGKHQRAREQLFAHVQAA